MNCPAGCEYCENNVCFFCAAGYYISGGVCIAVAHSLDVNSAGTILSCEANYWLSGGTCIGCTDGCLKCEMDVGCIHCGYKYYLSGNACVGIIIISMQTRMLDMPGGHRLPAL